MINKYIMTVLNNLGNSEDGQSADVAGSVQTARFLPRQLWQTVSRGSVMLEQLSVPVKGKCHVPAYKDIWYNCVFWLCCKRLEKTHIWVQQSGVHIHVSIVYINYMHSLRLWFTFKFTFLFMPLVQMFPADFLSRYFSVRNLLFNDTLLNIMMILYKRFISRHDKHTRVWSRFYISVNQCL